MTVKQAIEELQKLNPLAVLGSFNPVVNETIYIAKFEPIEQTFVQVEFSDTPENDTETFQPL